jgi:flagellar motility protein MotE (MotC chaperone)
LTSTTKKNRVTSTIAVLSFFLFGSAILRTALSTNEAFAQSAVEENSIDETGQSELLAAEPTSKFLEALIERERKARILETELSTQRKAIKIAKSEIERRLIALEQAETNLSATLSRANTAAETDIRKLIEVYENMKPKETAALFETMEPVFAAGFLGRMQPESAAGVMAGLSPKVAYSISAILAGQNSNAPRN